MFLISISALHEVEHIWAIKGYGNFSVGCTFSTYCVMEIFFQSQYVSLRSITVQQGPRKGLRNTLLNSRIII